MILGFRFRGVVVTVIRNIAGPVFDEVVIGIETRALELLSRDEEKLSLLVLWHVEIDRFEQTARNEAATQIAQNRIARSLPLLDVKDKIRIVDLHVIADRERLAPQYLFERSTRCM